MSDGDCFVSFLSFDIKHINRQDEVKKLMKQNYNTDERCRRQIPHRTPPQLHPKPTYVPLVPTALPAANSALGVGAVGSTPIPDSR
jgi:hypothetical protein